MNNRFCRFRLENPDTLRYYEICLKRDLFDWCLTLIWGGKGTSLGQMRHYPCLSFEEGYSKIITIIKKRKRHGYVITIEKIIGVSLSISNSAR